MRTHLYATLTLVALLVGCSGSSGSSNNPQPASPPGPVASGGGSGGVVTPAAPGRAASVAGLADPAAGDPGLSTGDDPASDPALAGDDPALTGEDDDPALADPGDEDPALTGDAAGVGGPTRVSTGGNTGGTSGSFKPSGRTGRNIGDTTPEIEGEDIDGVRFKLSDYRGKVVVLDFWGHWCPHCRNMYPHERSLVRRLAGKPFALIGVNSDSDRQKLKAIIKQNGITWRSFWNGGSPRGPISSAWGVQGWPTIYVLDQKGRVRYKNVRGKAMDEAVDTLLAEMENESIGILGF